MKKTLLISTFLVSIFYHFQVNATELTKALIEEKPLQEIQSLIKKGVDVNQADEETGYYPLMMVKDTVIFQELVNAGADIKAKTQDGNSVFNITCAQGTLDMVKFLLANTDSNINEISGGMTPLMRTLFNKDPQVAEFLIKSGADVNIETTLANGQKTTALKMAIYRDEPTLVKLLIENGATYEKDKILSDILNRISSEKTWNMFPGSEKNYDEYIKQRIALIEFLIDKGVNINATDKDGQNLLYRAIDTKNSSLLEYLIQKGVNVNCIDNDGITLLMYAVLNKSDANMVKKLIDHGADKTKRDKMGLTAYQQAVEFHSDQEIRELLFVPIVDKKSENLADKAMVQHYANSLMMDASMLSILAISADGGEGKDISSDEVDDFKNRKIACGAKLFGKKDGSVIIEFPENCVRMGDNDTRFNVSIEEVIKAAKKDKYSILTCSEHKCTWEHKH